MFVLIMKKIKSQILLDILFVFDIIKTKNKKSSLRLNMLDNLTPPFLGSSFGIILQQ